MCAGGQRKRRAAPRQQRQAVGAKEEEEEEDVEAEFNPENPYQVSHAFFSFCRVYVPVQSQCLSIQIRGLPEKAFAKEGFSQLCEQQQMLGSRAEEPGLSLQV